MGGGGLSGGALPGRTAPQPKDRHFTSSPRGPRGPRGLGARVGRGRPGALPLERGPEDLRHVRGRGVAAPQEPLRAGEGPRRRDVLGVPRRPHGGAPRHARRGASRRGRGAALRGVALRSRPRRRGARCVLGEPDARREDPAPGSPAGPGFWRRRHRRHEVDGADRRSVLLHVAALRALPAARERQGPVLAAAGQALRRPGLVRARGRGAVGVEGPPRRAASRAAALADDRLARRPDRRLERQPLDTPRARPRHGRAGEAPAHDPCRQPPRRGRRPQLAQRHRPHAVQLERHRGPHRAAGGEPGVDRGPAGHAPRRAAHGDRPGNDRLCHEAGRPRVVTARRGSFGWPRHRANEGRRLVGCLGRRLRGRDPSRSERRSLGRVLSRASGPACRSRDAPRSRRPRGPLRPAGDRDAGHAVRGERTQGLPPRHARVRHLPEDRPPPDRRGLLAAHRAHREGARSQHDPLPLVVPARRRPSPPPTRRASTTRSRSPPGRTAPPVSAAACRSTSGSTARPAAS